MKIRCLALSAAVVSLAAVLHSASGQELVVNPETRAVPQVYTIYQNGVYSPFPGIVTPVPYPNTRAYPPHWIYSYMRPDSYYRQANDAVDGKSYRGRETLDPAVPYSDYLRGKAELPRPREVKTTDKALLEIRVPTDNTKLFFDGKEAPGDGETRTFYTPVLAPGETYRFTLKATWPGLINDLSNEQIVSFQAGDQKKIDLRPKN